MSISYKNIWSCIAHVKDAPNGTTLETKGAYVKIIGYAENQIIFFNKIELELNNLELICIEIEDVEKILDIMKEHTVNKKIISKIKEVSISQGIGFMHFHTYDE